MSAPALTRKVTAWAAIGLALLAGTACARDAAYLAPDKLDLTQYLAPPPAVGTPAQQRDIEAVLAAQSARTPAMVAAAQADQTVSVFRFADVLGPEFNAGKLPLTDRFFKNVGRDASRIGGQAKVYWQRPRPYRTDDAVKPVLGVLSDGSYPSGHSMYGCLSAVLLGTMVPERRAELLARGETYGQNRIIGGVHYPTDVAAGCSAGRIMAALLLQSPAMQADLDAARKEIRATLGLP